jgi:carboxypeptidase C (cathepsin A)
MHLPNIRTSGRSLLLLLLLLASATTLAAQERPRRPQQQQQQQQIEQPRPAEQHRPSSESVLRLIPADSVTEHSVMLPGGKLDYTATAGTIALFDRSGERAGLVYYTAFVAKAAEPGSRPITFAFNGGPGAASAFLTLGLVGPRIAEFPGNDAAAVRLVDNPDTWLAFTDLVMIDPVGTGWSRAAKSDTEKAMFYGVRQDAQALAKFIANYLTKTGRNGSPKYLLGESYGGFRAAKVARALQHDQGIAVAGIVMVSPLIAGDLSFSQYALGAALRLPSLAAAAMERNGSFSKEAQADAERFALTDYLTTLAAAPPKGEAAKRFYGRVAQLTGLPEDVVARSRGFIHDAYLKHLRSAEGKVVSRYDASFAVADPHPEQQSAYNPDPLLDGLTRAYGSAFAAYARDELGFKTELTYNLLNSEVTGAWEWGGSGGRATASVTNDIRELLSLTPSFRLMIAHGYSDMVTPYGASRYVLDHLPPIGEPSRTGLQLYRGGHMFYIDAESRKTFSADARTFYQSSQ